MDRELIKIILYMLVGLGLFVGTIWYSVWQFQMCYPEVSNSWWYCFQHAFGG